LESEAAAVYLCYFQEGVVPELGRRNVRAWCAYGAGLAAAPLPGAGPPAALVPTLVRLQHPGLFLEGKEPSLAAFPLLAVRAARRAIAADPRDGQAYLQLGRAYLALWNLGGERPLSKANPLLANVRHIQTVTALEQALRADPGSETAHQLLARVYRQHGYLDVALDHRREALRLTRRAGPRPGESRPEFERRLLRGEQETQALERPVREHETRFADFAAGSSADAVGRARVALRLGLARRALDDILSQASPVLLESGGIQLQLEVALQLGRIEEIRDVILDPRWEGDKANLGVMEIPAPPLPGYPKVYRLPAYPWLRLCWAAAAGDYDRAEAELHEILRQVEGWRRRQMEVLGRSLALALATEVALSSQPQGDLPRLLAQEARAVVTQFLDRTRLFQGDQADLLVLGGILALERGLVREARGHFEDAFGMSQPAAGPPEEFAAQPAADAYLRRIRAAGELLTGEP
jgi:tetratricopeptide (TPR) repeat protein